MPATIFGNPAVAIGLYQTFYGKAPANATYVNNVALAAQNGPSALAAAIGANFATTPAADLAKTVLANLGISNATLETALGQIFTAYPASARGQIVLNLTSLLSGLENDATFGAAAKAYNVTVAANNAYSSNVANTTDSVPGTTTGNEAGKSTVLTVSQDVLTGTAVADFFRGVAGVQVGSQDQTTLNSADIIDGAGGDDTLVVNMTGPNYIGGARLKSIETLQIGTNLAAANFDYNVNQGDNEINGTTKIVYDQINAGEDLTVQNILKTGTDLPTIAWVNEATSVAGTANVAYRASAVEGATNQNVELSNVNASNVDATTGRLNIAAGVETLTINNVSAGKNTLNNSTNQPTANAAGVDLVSGTAGLTKVVVTGAGAFGEDANVVTQVADGNYGLTNRAANGANDLGLSNTRTSASNLVSLANTVTEYDASAATGSQAVRFTPNVTANTAVNVTFKGGSAADYVEFELGNINYNGGAGDDVAAFVNTGANSTFGEGDTMVGGEGSDTIQLGLNGAAGTYNVSETELRNKTSFGTIDLRGNSSNLTLSSDFVAAADTANSITIRTDKIVQTSDTVATNDLTVATNNGLENASTHTVNLTKLGSGQSVSYMGGSGSDRIILNDATFNVLKTLDGGAIEGQVTGANNNRFDTITIVTNGENVVIDAQDLSNVKNFEGFVLTKNSNAATYNITLTKAFITANTLATDDATTTTAYNDTVFQIGTSNAANNSALGAGDTVVINVADLLDATNTARAAGWTAARSFDVTSLEAAGVTVTFVGNAGAAVTAATLRGLGVLQNNGAVANINDVVVNSAAVPGVAPLFFQGTVADETVTLVDNANSVDMAGGADTLNTGAALAPTGNLNGGDGTDTLNAANGVNLTGATITSFETLNLNGAATLTAAQYSAFTTVTGAGGADAVTLTTTGNVNGFAAVETYNLSAAGNQITLAGASAQTINGGVGADTVIASGTNIANKTILLNGGADTVTVTSWVTAAANAFTLAAAGASGANLTGVETVNFSNGLIQGTGVMTMFNGAATVNLAGTVGDSSATDALQLGTGGQTVNVTGTDGFTLAGGSGADTFNLSGLTAGAASTTITLSGAPVAFGAAAATGAVSLVSAFDTITGFRAGVDKIDAATAGGANQLTTINVNVSTSLADLAGTLNNAVTQAITLAAANWNAAGDALLVNISSGTAAGTYLVQNAAADATFDAAAELVVKLVGTVGVITQADII